MSNSLKVLSDSILSRILDDDEDLIYQLANKGLSVFQRTWPRDNPLSTQEEEALRLSLHWIIHMAGEASRAISIVLKKSKSNRIVLSIEEWGDLNYNVCFNLLLYGTILMSNEIKDKTLSAIIESGFYLPEDLREYASRRFQCTTWTEFGNMSPAISNIIDKKVTSGEVMLSRFITLCNDFLQTLDWLLSAHRPGRYKLAACLAYLHSLALQLVSQALILPFWLEAMLEPDCKSAS